MPTVEPAAATERLTVAIVGKGGSGKSAITGTICRLLGRRGRIVLALDMDTVPGLALSLGIPDARARLPAGLAEVVSGRRGRRWTMVKGAGAATLVDRHSVKGPDNVRFLELGKLPGGIDASVSMAFRHVAEKFRRPGWTTVGDLAAGTRQPMYGWSRFARIRPIVVEPSAKGIISARRLLPVATHLIVSKTRGDGDVDRVTSSIPLPLLGAVPYDEDLAEAERHGLAPIDGAPESAAVRAISDIVDRLEDIA